MSIRHSTRNASPYTPAMAPIGTFAESDPSEIVELLDQKVLKSGLGRFFRRFDGVGIRPAIGGESPGSMRKATEAGIPQASINKGGLVSKGPTVHLWPPSGMSERDAVRHVAAAGIGAPEPRKALGQYSYD